MLWDDFISSGNVNYVFQAPDTFHFLASEESVKYDLMEIGLKIDPDFFNVVIEFSHIVQTTVTGTQSWEEFAQLMAQRYFDKYRAKPHWAKRWEFIPNLKSYLSDVLSDQIKQFEKVRAKYDPDKIFFDNKSLQDILVVL
ncbi:6427_t:CDS:2 [Dentiscutata erythropus]|uniref:6427_t:CDS:1 n=1 Tax=Dentiscutata erythropus TaxID=1348616 RepID=A0A9N8VAN5_9GLOM|nr:6427_t:CDS:2 [Dentiscutata erythropus]